MADPTPIRIFDTTLRDGEQSPGASLNHEEKIEIARQLEALGVDIIEAGFPITSQGDFEAVKAIGKDLAQTTVCGLARCVDRDIERAAEAFGCHPKTVANVRQRLVEGGLDAAIERKKRDRPPRTPVCDGEAEARIIALRCGEPPAGRARWTLRLLAEKAVELEIVPAISHETVRQVLKKTS